MAKYNILLVGSDAEVNEIIKGYIMFMGREKFDIKAAQTNDTAMEILEKEKTDFIVIDVKMSEIDGIELLTALQNRKKWLPLVLVTNLKLKNYDNRLGLIYFLSTPLVFKKLYNLIENFRKKKYSTNNTAARHTAARYIAAIYTLIVGERRSGTLKIKCKDGEKSFLLNEGKLADAGPKDLFCKDPVNEKVKFIENIVDRNKSLEEIRVKASSDPYQKVNLMTGESENYTREVNMAITKEILNSILEVDGVQGVAIYISTGEVVISDSRPSFQMADNAIGAFATELFKSSTKVMNELDLGITNFFRIETDKSIFVHKCIYVGKSAIGVIADNSANIGILLIQMDKVIESAKKEL